MKYSQRFNEDYGWYLKNKDIFKFCGKAPPFTDRLGNNLVVPDLEKGKSSKECFYVFDSTGKIIATREPELLFEILRCKAGINWQIKQWAEGLINPFLDAPLFDSDKLKSDRAKICFALYVEFKEVIIPEFDLLKWQIEAVYNQAEKLFK